MDRASGKEVGGPYASRADAERAIEAGTFGKSSTELSVEEESEDDGPESVEASKHAHLTSTQGNVSSSPQGPQGSFEDTSFQRGGTPQTDTKPGPSDPDFHGHDQPLPQQSVQPSYPQTTKPSQVPQGSGSTPGMGAMPEMPMFDPSSLTVPTWATQHPDPVDQKVSQVTTLVQRQNPHVDEVTARRVARKVVGLMVEADWGWTPFHQHVEIPENPLRHLHHVVNDPLVRKYVAPAVRKHLVDPVREKVRDVLTTDRSNPSRERNQDLPPTSPPEHARPQEKQVPLIGEDEAVDLSEFDKRPSSLPRASAPSDWGMGPQSPRQQELWERLHSPEAMRHHADWGWTPHETQPEIPSHPSDAGSSSGSGPSSSLPKMPKLPGTSSGGAETGAETGAAEGVSGLAEELPLLLV